MPYIVIGGVLYHYGIPGMEWGKRRFQNKDGSLTEAGKRRYAKSVQRYVKQTPSVQGKQLAVKRVAQDIASQKNMLGMESTIEGVFSAKARLEDMRRMDDEFHDSPEYKKAWEDAYDATYAALEKEDPDALAEMIRRNNGIRSTLNQYHDFDTTMDGYLDEYYDKARDEFGKSRYGNSFSTEKLMAAERSYDKACSGATKQLLGRYGHAKVKYSLKSGDTATAMLEDIVSASIDLMYRTPLDELRKDN